MSRLPDFDRASSCAPQTRTLSAGACRTRRDQPHAQRRSSIASLTVAALLLVSAGAVSSLTAAATHVVVRDTWQDGTRTDPASPTYAENNGVSGTDADSDGDLESVWFFGGTGSLTASSGRLTATGQSTSSQSYVTYFAPQATPVTLTNPGDSMKLTWSFTPTGVNANNTSQGFNIALAQTPSSVTRLTTNGSIPTGIYTGYALLTNMGQVLGNGAPFNLKKWSATAAGALLGTSGNWATSLGNGATSAKHGYDSGTSYTLTVTVTRDATTPTSLNLVATMTGGTLNDTGTATVSATDTTPAGFSFDTFAVRPSSEAAAAATIVTTLFKVEYSNALLPGITSQPESQTAGVGGSVTFSVTASGAAPLTYQWQMKPVGGSFANIADATSPSLPLTNLQSAAAGDYRVIVTNSAGTATSDAATLNIADAAQAPVIQTDPQSATLLVGDTTSFTVTAVSVAPMTYQWSRSTNGGSSYADIVGATAASYPVSSAQLSDAGLYRVTVTNATGAVTSAAATLTVNQAPDIVTQPVGATLTVGAPLTLSVAASGTPAPSYQWYRNGAALPGATAATYTVASVTGANTGAYSVVVSNGIGSAVTSTTVSVAVLSTTMAPTAATPAPGATAVLPDTRLTITFNTAPTLGTGGTIALYDASNDTAVDTIDLVAASLLKNSLRAANTLSTLDLPVATKAIGGVASWNYYPLTVSGNTVTIHPRNGVLAYGKSYYVQIAPGAFLDSTGLSFAGIADKTSWTFTTTAATPASATQLTVAADGTGDFHTVQAAIDAVPAGNTTPTRIFIKNGTYFEIVYFTGKHHLTFRGEDAAQTKIVFPSNNNFNAAGPAYHRGTFFANAVHDIVLANLTIQNSTPQGGSQAEALILSGTATAGQNIVTRCNLFSYQDTLQVNGQAFVSDSRIEGDVDFLWGTGPVFFSNCTIKMLRSSGGYFAQVRNPATNHGYIFNHCRFIALAGSTANFLNRIDPNAGQFPFSEVVLLNCRLGDATNNAFLATAVGNSGANYTNGWWLLNNASAANQATLAANLRNWDSGTTDANGAVADYAGRVPFTTWTPDATALANYSNPAWVLGTTTAGVATASTWTPTLAPSILSQPASLTVSAGAAASFTVDVAAVPAATYQWQKNGSDLVGAIAATYTIVSTAESDAGSYTVTVTNSADSVTSSAATLTVDALPVAPAIATQPAGQTVTVGSAASFTVLANGTAPLAYQWQLNGTDIPSATAATLSFASAQPSDAGSYTVVVTNSVSSITSTAATLTVNPPVALPAAPVANAAAGIGNNGFTASWSAATGATGYRLDVSTDSAFGSFVTGYQDLDVGTNLSRAVTGLTAGTAYSYRVRAVNSAGASASSNVIAATTTNRVNLSIVASGTTSDSVYSLTGSAYNQNFDTLPTAAFTWVNDSTLPGWHALNTAGTFDSSAVISDGSANLADLKIASVGATASTERALAYHTRVSTASTYLGLAFVNNSGGDLDTFTLTYTPEQWKEGTDSRTLTFTVQYRVGAGTSDLNAASGWTTLSGLAATTLAGSAGKTATLTASAIPVTVPSGSTIWFRWITANTATSPTSSHDTLAVDNVSVSFTAAPVTGAPVITAQPASQSVNRGTDVTLSVAATSETALSYQWKKAGIDLPGATTATLTIAAAQVADSGAYTVVVTNAIGGVLSQAATLTVNNVVTAPTITAQPQSLTLNTGDTAIFTVVASGTAPLTYQWRKNGNAIAAALADTLALNNVQPADAASYTVVVSNEGGSTTSSVAVLTLSGVVTPPSILSASGSQSVLLGGTVSLSVVAAGTEPFAYQWKKDSAPIAGATGTSLTLSNIALTDGGSYTVTVANSAGSVTADPAVITVTEPPTTSAGTLFVAPDGLAGNPGTFAQPTTLANAITLVPVGGTIYVRGGTYAFSTEVRVERGNNGSDGLLKRLFAYTPAGGIPEKPVFDFSSQPYGSTSSVSNPRGLWLGGNYWHLKGLEVKGAADNGIYVTGNHNLVELCITHANRDTGLQIGRYSSTAPSSEWPSDNLILNCESYDNNDSAPNSGENADGFACKLTSGPGNVFRGCVSHHNIDDGWDLFTKTETGAIGPVTIDQCIAYGNGTLTDGTQNPAGDKNGFKLGGAGIANVHYVSRCIAFNNGKNGFTWNSNPGAIVLVNNLAWDNVEGNYKFDSGAATFYNNISLWTTSTGAGNRTGISDRYVGNSGVPTGASNIFWFTASSSRGPSINDSGLSAYKTAFRSLTVPTGGFARHADGSLALGDFARPVASSPLFNAGVLPPGASIAPFPFATAGYYENAPDLGAVETYLATPPTITSAPASQSVLTGAVVTFSVSVIGTEPFTYQWKKGAAAISGATASTYTIPTAQASDSGSYTVAITNSVSTVTSDPAVLTVAAPTAPTITTQPTARTANIGLVTTFNVAASGTSPFAYQWYQGATAISGAISSSYTIAGVQTADAGSYTVVVTNSVGSATSDAAVLTVDSAAIPPTIATQPTSAIVVLGSSVTFGVVASGSSPFTYQWKKDGTDIASATAATLTLANVQASDAGSYTVAVANAGGSVTSTAATLTVNAAPDTVYISDAFADGTRSGQSLPSSAAWWTSSGASNFTATTGAATQVVSSARTILAYFTSGATTPVTLALNQKLTFEFVVQFTGFDSAAGAGVSNLRVGLLRSPADAQRFAADFASGQPATHQFANYTGYAALSVANAVGDSIPVSFGVRDQVNDGLLNNTLAFTVPANGTPAASPAMATATDYRITFSVTRSSGGSVLYYKIARLNDSAIVMEHSVTDAATTFSAFDTAALYFGKASGSSTYNIVLKSANVALGNLAVPTAPSIATPPASQSVGVGSTVTLAVTASGTAPFTYQWHKGATDIPGATTSTLTLTSVQLADAGDYSVTVTNSLGHADSTAATLTVTAATAPAIATQPQSSAVTLGNDASFTVVATGTAPLAYAWRHGTTSVGTNSATLALTAVQDADAGSYTVTVSNSAGSATSDAANLTVNPLPPQAPAIATQPTSQTVAPGATATFTVVATGTPTPTYQWKKNNTDLPTATGSTLTLTNVQLSDAGSYTVTVANSAGNVTSTAATLTLSSSLPVTAFNLTGFATVGSGTTGGGGIAESDIAYRKVSTPQEFVQAIIDSNKTAGKVKVIEILNDLNLGWIEVGATVQNLASNPLRAHATPKLHPTLIASGVSVLDIKARSPLTIFSASGATIKHVNFNVKGTTNIVIRNLKFDELWEWDESSKGNYDSNDWDFITLSNGGDVTNVWIDHCTFTKAYDGIVDLKAGTQYATLSWCKYVGDDGATNPNSHVRIQLAALEANKSAYPFYNFLRTNGYTLDDIAAVIQGHDKGHLMGSNSLKPENDTLTATFHHQWLKNVWDRAIPRLRGGNVHDYNIFIDDTEALAARRLRDTKAALLSVSLQNTLNNTYSFRPFLNGAISTEGGSVLVEKSIYKDCLWPLRNNQTDVNNAAYTGKIKSIDSIYRFLNADNTTTVVRGDSTDAGNPMGPFQATVIPFAWDLSGGVLPYTYTADDPAQLESILTLGAGAGTLSWSKDNWLKTTYVADTNSAPSITAHPQARTVAAGVDATFTVQASGSGTLTYQWKKGGANLTDGGRISGATSAVLTLSAADVSDIGTYTVVVTNSVDNVTSNAAALTVTTATAPTVTTPPQSQTVLVGSDVQLSVLAAGSAPFSYQWKHDGNDVVGATGATLDLLAVQLADAGAYTVVVTNTVSSVTSAAALLNVGTVPAAPVANAATHVGAAGFTANWSAASAATGYRLDISSDSAFGSFVTGYADLDVGTDLSAAVTGLSASTPYYYRVRAANAFGPSPTSATITATTASAPQPPATPAATIPTAVTTSGFTATWSAASDATGYRLDVSTDNAFASFVAGYQDLDVANALTKAVTGLSASTSYYYRVRATNAGGISASSTPVSVTTNSAALSLTTQPVTQVVASGSAITFTVVATGTSPFTYQWQKDSVNLTATANITGVTSATLSIGAATAADIGTYRVIVTNAAAATLTSDSAALSIQPQPTANTATNVSLGGFTAGWNTAFGATGYLLEVSTSRTFGNNPPTIPNTFVPGYQGLDVGTNLSFAVTGLKPDTTYFYRVRPYNTVGIGANSTLSNVVVVRTPSSSAMPPGTAILDETFPNPTANPIPDINAGLTATGDPAAYLIPTASQAVWFSGGTSSINYLNSTLLSVSAGASRGYIAYFRPSNSAASLAIGETLSATVRLKFTDGSAASGAGNFRIALLNSNANGTNVNVTGSTNASNPARVTAPNFSITNDIHANGYSGYIAESTASQTAPSANSIGFYRRVQATHPNDGTTAPSGLTVGSKQWVGPAITSSPGTLLGLSQAATPSNTFLAIGAAGGGTVGAMTNDGSDYLVNLSVRYVSATQIDLSYTVTNGGTVVQSHSTSQNSGSLVTAFDSLFLFSNFNTTPTVLGLTISKIAPDAPPSITSQPAPASQAVNAGSTVSYSVGAIGSNLTYQWKKDTVNLTDASGHVAGATTANLVLTSVQPADAGSYTVVVTSTGGSVTSTAATLAIQTPPVITTQPVDHSVVVDSTASFTVAVTGTAPFTYQWKHDGNDIAGANAATLNLTQIQVTDAGAYTVVVTNAVASVTSTAGTLTVTAGAVPPTITTQPQSQTAVLNGGVTFSVAATGTAPLSYQWSKDGTSIPSATTSSLSLTNVQPGDAGSYTVAVANSVTSITSAAAALTVSIPAPTIVVQPQTQSALTGTRASLSVFATGYGTLTYQWIKNGTPVSGATGQSLSLANLQASDATSYTVTVTNPGGSTTSASAVLSLVAPAATLPTQPTIPAAIFKVTDFGAVADGTTNNATAIQAAITAAANAGGGTVELPPAAADYLSGPISLRSNINLQIDGGATLRALPYGTYANGGIHFITAPSNSSNIALTGNGTIEGDGSAWWIADANAGGIARPRLVNVTRLTNVLVSGLTFRNAPQFHLAIGSSTDVTLFGLTITAPSSSPNTDGIDPSGFNFLIQGCSISVGDDNIAVKAGDACGNFTIADCAFGTGHGMSVGGQSNAGLNGMNVMRCTFNGTSTGLRLKADATQGGPVQNLTYSDLVMTNVPYPIVFYSYYNQVGSPGAVSGSSQTTPAKVLATNATPPNPLNSGTIPTWKNIAINNLTATGATGYSIIWGLPLADALIANVTLNNVSIAGGPGLEIYNATNVQFTGTTAASTLGGGTILGTNSLGITRQPQNQSVNAGDPVSLSITTVGTSGVSATAPTFQWKRNGSPLANGTQANGSTVAGATSATLAITNTHPGDSADYTCTVSLALDGYDTATSALVAGSLPVSATSRAATVSVTGAGAAPSITTQPADQSVAAGATATFSVGIATDSPATYVWKKGAVALSDIGGHISGATTDTLTITNAQAADVGDYSVVITNGVGPVTSNSATLTVQTPPLPSTASAAGAITATGFAANWGSVSGATGYRLDVSLHSDFRDFLTGYADLDVGAVLSANVTGLAGNTTYYYRVRAYNAFGASASSGTISLTTPSAHQSSMLTTILHDTFIAAAANDGLLLDANGYRAPTSTQAVWFAGGTTATYLQNTSIGVSAGNRGLLAYFSPSTSVVTLGVGETLTAVVKFKYTLGTATGASSAGDFRLALLNSGGNGGPNNDGASANPRPAGEALPAARIVADNFSLTSTSGGISPARGYSGYLINATAAATAPTADTLSFWRRDGGQGKSQQWAGPIPADIAANTTFSLLGRSAAGTIGAIAYNGTVYTATLSLSRTSATDTVLTYTVTDGTNTVMSYSTTESSASPIPGFDSLMLLSSYAASLAVTDLTVTKVLVAPTIQTQPVAQSVRLGANATFSVGASGSGPLSYQWKQGGTNLVNGPHLSGADTATLTVLGLTLADAGSYTVEVSNSVDTITSSAAALTVDTSVAPTITTQPGDLTKLVGQTATFTVVATGTPAPTYQWRKNTVALDSATTATLLIAGVTLGDAGSYDVVVTNSAGSVSSAVALLTVNAPVAPTFTTSPSNQVIRAGQSVTFSAVATGSAPVTYQWRRNGIDLSGATAATLTIANLQFSDAGDYTVVATNSGGNITSSAGALVVISAAHAVAGGGYKAGGTLTIINTITYSGTLSGLGWQALLPTGWSFASSAGQEGNVKPLAGTTDLAEWAWTTIPASPITFSYVLNVPAGTSAPTNLNAVLLGRQAGVAFTLLVLPDPLVANLAPALHSADTSRDSKLSLSELLRVIELYNTRNGSTRTGRYQVNAGTEDGFDTDAVTANSATVVLATYHSADTSRDGKLSLAELLRVIELYNYRSGSQRTGQYHALSASETSTEDGFAPGPIPL